MRVLARLVCTLLPLVVFLPSCSPPASSPVADVPQTSTNSDTAISIHLELGYPHDADTTDDFLVVRPQYVASFSYKRNTPNWVSWNLNSDWFGDVPRYEGNFIVDPMLPESFYHPDHNDYTNSGYDRGHMVRSEERTKTPEDNRSTFYMTNIIPQRPDLNRGVWLDFERYCESLCKDSLKQLFIVAGPVFSTPQPTIIGQHIAVPDSCFKIVVVLDRGQKRSSVTATTPVIAVMMPNRDGVRKDDWTLYRSTIDDIEARTGYDFLNDIAPSIQALIEAK